MTSKNSSESKSVIPYGRQWVTAADIRAVVKVLRSDWLTQGPLVRRFEEAFAKYCGAPYAVAVSSGTAGLHLACLAAGFKKGDEVLTSPMTFAATANAALFVGAEPVFADVEKRFIGPDPSELLKKKTRRTRGILNVHFGGHPSMIGPKKNFSSQNDFYVIEDACHALGAEVQSGGRWKRIGSCDDADMSVFSFHPVKHITTGEGGMIVTRRRDLYEKLLLLRSHGIEKDPARFTDKTGKTRPWHYEMQALGFNYRITDIQCALGLSQLDRLDEMVARRRDIAVFYGRALKDIDHLKLPLEDSGSCRSSYHLFALRIDFKKIRTTRENVMKTLRQKGVGTQVHYIPVVSQPYYKKRYGLSLSDYPECARYYAETLSIPLFPSMTKSDRVRVVRALKDTLRPLR